MRSSDSVGDIEVAGVALEKGEPVSNLVKHAELEMGIVGTDLPIREVVLKMQVSYAEQGHSGCSASVFRGLFQQIIEDKKTIDECKQRVSKEGQEEGPDKWLSEGILEVMEILRGSALKEEDQEEAAQIFLDLAAFNPLSPLTGKPEEWNDLSEGDMSPRWQNKRFPDVFMNEDGSAYHSGGRVFRDPDGSCWTSLDSRVPIIFPYIPQVEYVDRLPLGVE